MIAIKALVIKKGKIIYLNSSILLIKFESISLLLCHQYSINTIIQSCILLFFITSFSNCPGAWLGREIAFINILLNRRKTVIGNDRNFSHTDSFYKSIGKIGHSNSEIHIYIFVYAIQKTLRYLNNNYCSKKVE